MPDQTYLYIINIITKWETCYGVNKCLKWRLNRIQIKMLSKYRSICNVHCVVCHRINYNIEWCTYGMNKESHCWNWHPKRVRVYHFFNLWKILFMLECWLQCLSIKFLVIEGQREGVQNPFLNRRRPLRSFLVISNIYFFLIF